MNGMLSALDAREIGILRTLGQTMLPEPFFESDLDFHLFFAKIVGILEIWVYYVVRTNAAEVVEHRGGQHF